MKRLVFAVLFTFLFIFTISASLEELPYYFPEGITSTTDPLEQFQEYLRYINAMGQCYQPIEDHTAPFISGNDIRIETDLVSTSSYTKNPAKMTIVLDQHVRLPDGTIRYTNLCGQRILGKDKAGSDHLLKVIEESLKKFAVEGARLNNKFYSEVIDIAVNSIADTLGMTPDAVRTQLDKKVPGTDLTFREYWFVPRPSKESDFIPRELHLGPTPSLQWGILGVTWLNTGVIYYNPMSHALDYLKGTPSVLQHEEVHNNVNLQKFPFGDGIDLELAASIDEALLPENKIDLLYHGYVGTPRWLAQYYFSFPFDEVRDRVIRFDAGGNLWINAEAYRKYFEQLEQIKAELRIGFKKTLAEYYSKQVWWMALHKTMNQDDAVFKIMMAQQYDLTALGGRDKTMHLMEVHREEIMKSAEESFNEQKGSSGELMPRMNIPQPLIDFYKSVVPEKQRTEIEKYFRKNPEKLKALANYPDKIIEFFKNFYGNENGEGGVR